MQDLSEKPCFAALLGGLYRFGGRNRSANPEKKVGLCGLCN
jgi:hypothetical protein